MLLSNTNKNYIRPACTYLQVIYDYWTKGLAVNPRYSVPDSTLDQHIKVVVATEVRNVMKEFTEQFGREAVASNSPSIALLREEFAAAENLAAEFYADRHQIILAANNVLKQKYHQDVLQLLEVQLIAEKKEKLLTPTEIGKLLGISAREVNKRLYKLGLQQKSLDGKSWMLTDRGKKFGEYLDTAKRHHSGTPVQQLKWYESVKSVLQEQEL